MRLLVILMLGSLFACSPRLQSPELQNPQVTLGPTLSDTNVEIVDTSLNKPIAWKTETDSAEILSTIESLMNMSQTVENPKLKTLSDQLNQDFYNSEGVTTTASFETTPYIQVALAEVSPTVKLKINDALLMLREQSELINNIFEHSKKLYSWKYGLEFEAALWQVDDYMTYITQSMREQLINSKIVEKFSSEQESTLRPMIRQAVERYNTIKNSSSLTIMIENINTAIEEYEIEVTPEQESKLQEGKNLGSKIDRMTSEQDGLSLIVLFWRKMTPKERIEIFAKENRDLYDYLFDKDEGDLDCLASSECSRPIMNIAKNRIFKKIREYGLGNLKLKFNSASMNFALSNTESIYPILYKKVPNEINSRVQAAILENRQKFMNIRDNFTSFFFDIMKKWSQKNLYNDSIGLMNGVEVSQIQISNKNGNISFKPIETRGIQTSTESIGNSFSLKSMQWTSLQQRISVGPYELKQSLMRNVLEQVNKMLAMIGFRKENNGVFPSFVIPLNPNLNPKNFVFDYSLISEPKILFAFPDFVKIKGAYEPDKAIVKKQISVRSQAELLRGLANMMEFFKDWKNSTYDETLGQVKVRDLNIDWVPEDMLETSLFPKESLFALTVGNSLIVLQNLIKELSPVFLINASGKLTWSNERSMSSDNPDVKAGVVDIVDGKRVPTVKTTDLAKYLMACIQFYRSSEEIELSHSSILTQKQSDGITVAQRISNLRSDIRSLVLGLANYLSSEMKDKDGGFVNSLSIDLNTLQKQDGDVRNKTLEDQAYGIKALLMAAQFTGLKLYEWSAIEAYYYMNKNMWNTELGYYSSSSNSDSVDYADTVSSLEALTQLRNVVKGESLEQLTKIIDVSTARLVRGI